MSKEQRIKAALGYAGVSQAKVAAAIGTMASNFNQKLKRETFTEEELELIAKVIGAELQPCAFVFSDGTTI